MKESPLHKLPNAGLSRRLAAATYDWLLVLALMMVLSVPLIALIDAPISSGTLGYQVLLIAIAAVFFASFWHFGGQTLGMRAWRLRLVANESVKVGWSATLVRFIAACGSAVPAGAGFWWLWFDHDNLTWHDRLSRTRIVVLPKNPRN